MKKISIEGLMLAIMISLIIGLVAGFIVGKDFSERPIIIIDTSHEPTLDWFVKYHGQIEKGVDYNYQNGFSFERDGERISLFTNPARSAYADVYGEVLTEKEIHELYKQGPPKGE